MKRKPAISILIAGGEDEVLIDVVGQILANRYGTAAYDSLASTLSKQRDFAKVLSSPLTAEGSSVPTTLAETLDIFIGWTNKGWLPIDWLRFDSESCKRLLESGIVAASIQPLSFHRTISYDVIYSYKTDRMGIFNGNPRGPMTGPLVAAAIPRGARNSGKARRLLDFLLGAEGQKELAKESGCAPAVLSAQAPDIQASSVRAWAVASDRILQGLDVDVGVDRARLAKNIRDYIFSKTRK